MTRIRACLMLMRGVTRNIRIGMWYRVFAIAVIASRLIYWRFHQ